MNEEHRISRIDTLWSVVQSAQTEDNENARAAQQRMLDRYGTAVRRYLLGATRNEDLADELYQEFALRFLTGKYAGADADKGRFRSFLKTILYRLVAEHHRRRNRDRAVPMGTRIPEPVDTTPEQTDEGFAKVWSEELLKKAWAALKNLEERTGRPLFTVMQVKVDNPQLRSSEIAEIVSQRTGRDLSTGNARVILHRARETFADLLIDEVQQSLDTTSPERLEQELLDLNLLVYCRPALEKRNSQ